MKIKMLLSAFVLLALVYSCEKSEVEKSWVFIEETHCSNAWDELNYNSTKKKVEDYLKAEGITIYDFKAEVFSTGPFCEACSCTTGRYLRVQIEDKDIEAIKELGFEE